MPQQQTDHRSDARKAADELLAAEVHEPIPAVRPGDVVRPVESFLKRRRPVAINGIVENGMVRILDAGVSIPERSRVIIVASEPA